MVFHILHLPVPAFVEPLLQPGSLLFEKSRRIDPTGHKAKALGFGFNEGGISLEIRHVAKEQKSEEKASGKPEN